MQRCFRIMLLVGSAVNAIGGCSYTPNTEIVKYDVTSRQTAPEPVYSRVTWSHLPEPAPPRARPREDLKNVPLFHPVVSVELHQTSLGEAVQSLAQTIGYDWSFPKELARRKVRVKTVGTVEEVLKEIDRQAGVKSELDHVRRIVRVIDKKTEPTLPRH